MDWESIISLYKYWVESKLFVLCFVGGQWIIKVLRVLKERDAGDWVHSGQATSGRQRDNCDHIGTVRSVCSCQCQGNGQLTRYVSMTSCLDWNVSSWYTRWMCSIWKLYSEGAYFNLSWCVKQDTDNLFTWSVNLVLNEKLNFNQCHMDFVTEFMWYCHVEILHSIYNHMKNSWLKTVVTLLITHLQLFSIG